MNDFDMAAFIRDARNNTLKLESDERSVEPRRPKTNACGYRRDLTGRRFGRLTVLEYAGPRQWGRTGSVAGWRCRCDCGNIVILPGPSITRGNTKSCGCLTHAPRRERERTNAEFLRQRVLEHETTHSGRDAGAGCGNACAGCERPCGFATSGVGGTGERPGRTR